MFYNSFVLAIGWSIYIVIFACKNWLGIELPFFFKNYAADILCIPLVLGSIQELIRLIKWNNEILLKLPMVVVGVLVFSIVFEYVLPKYSSIYTSDIWDVACYILGGIIFLFFQKRDKKIFELMNDI